MAASPREDTLDILIQKITNPLSDKYDPALVYAFCERVKQQQDGPTAATRLLAYRVQSPQEREAMLALDLLDTCARTGGAGFQSEIGKFRFLNELIKLLSPRYLGQRTPQRVKQRTAQLLTEWVRRMPEEGKIAEAVQLLTSQGLLQQYGPPSRLPGGAGPRPDPELAEPETPASDEPADLNRPPTPPLASSERPANPIFDDSQKAALLKRLLQSTVPEDIQAANRLIKTMVKQDEERVERVSRRVSELETVRTNVRLLEEMLDNYSPESTSQDELDLMKELRNSCEQLRPKLDRLATETEDREQGLTDLVEATEQIEGVLSRHDDLLSSAHRPALTLLQLESPEQPASQPSQGAGETAGQMMLHQQLARMGLSDGPPSSGASTDGADLLSPSPAAASSAGPLADLLGSLSPPSTGPAPAPAPSPPAALQPAATTQVAAAPARPPPARSAFEDLDDLVRLSMSGSAAPAGRPQPGRSPPAVSPSTATTAPLSPSSGATPTATPPVAKKPISSESCSSTANQLLDSLTSNPFATEPGSPTITDTAEHSLLDLDPAPRVEQNGGRPIGDLLSDDVSILSALSGPDSNDSLLSDFKADAGEVKSSNSVEAPATKAGGGGEPVSAVKTLSLADVSVALEDIKPGGKPPVSLFTDQSALEIRLHPAQNRPRDDVIVYVITALNRTGQHVTQYTLQTVCDKGARVRLLPPSSSELQAGSPFLPPPAVSQVLLLANPSKIQVTLRLMLSYSVDGDTVTEMAEVPAP